MSKSESGSRGIAPFGEWPTPIDTRDVFARPGSPQFPQSMGGSLYWIQSLPEEGGRLVLVRQGADNNIDRITSPGYNLRSRVHEYGGRCHVLDGETCWFVNFEDQRLYSQRLDGSEPVAATAATGWMLADLSLHPSGRWLVGIGERKVDSGENHNAVVVVDTQSDDSEIKTLATGADFYSAPIFSPTGDRLAFVSWNHPNMPWDNTELQVGAFDSEHATLHDVAVVDGGEKICVCQPLFTPDGELIYARDSSADTASSADDFWNIFKITPTGPAAVTQDLHEYGAPHWVFGYRRLAAAANGNILGVATNADGETLQLIGADGSRLLPGADTEFTNFEQLSAETNNEVFLIAHSALKGSSVVSVDMTSGELQERVSGGATLDRAHISVAVPYVAATRDGQQTHAWRYEPRHADFEGPSDSQPPLMVLVHGGPTGRASAAFDPLRQFWTTKGFAVLDINHRGSTGYGRRYRQALNGLWGERDVDDIVDTIAALVADGGADPERVFIRGGSAGGFAVLAALTRYPDTFAAGACYYGIGNLVTLAMTTHKFESRYVDTLMGQPWSPELKDRQDTVYFTRSPIHKMGNVKAPMILFQGSDDKVVPPEVSREVVEVLKSKQVEHRYIEYAGEGHGFRKAENRIDALESEAAFFANVMQGTIG